MNRPLLKNPDARTLFYWYAVKAKIRLVCQHPSFLLFYLKYYSKRLGGGEADISVVSYSKSGRTWLESLLVETYCLTHQIPFGTLSTLNDVHARDRTVPAIRFTHAGTSWESAIYDFETLSGLEADAFAQGNVLFLYRDPRDVLVSCFYHLKYRTGITFLTADDILDSRIVGLKKIIVFMNQWYDYCQRNPNTTMTLSYETLKSESVTALRTVAAFVGLSCPENMIEAAVENCSFANMQQREKKDAYRNPWLSPRDPADARSYKVRKGKTGEYREFFSPEQITRLEDMPEAELNPAFGYNRRTEF